MTAEHFFQVAAGKRTALGDVDWKYVDRTDHAAGVSYLLTQARQYPVWELKLVCRIGPKSSSTLLAYDRD